MRIVAYLPLEIMHTLFGLGEEDTFSAGHESSHEVSFSGEILYWEYFSEFLCEISLYFLFTDSVLRVGMLRVTVQGKFSPGFNFSEHVSLEGEFSVEAEPDIMASFKKKTSEKKNNVFLTESKERH